MYPFVYTEKTGELCGSGRIRDGYIPEMRFSSGGYPVLKRAGNTMADVDDKLKAIADALNLLRSWHTEHLEKDHADLDWQILQLSKRLTRLEKAVGINDHGLAARLEEPTQALEDSTALAVRLLGDAMAADTPKPPRGRSCKIS